MSPGRDGAASAIVALGADGSLCATAFSGGGHLIVDVERLVRRRRSAAGSRRRRPNGSSTPGRTAARAIDGGTSVAVPSAQVSMLSVAMVDAAAPGWASVKPCGVVGHQLAAQHGARRADGQRHRRRRPARGGAICLSPSTDAHFVVDRTGTFILANRPCPLRRAVGGNARIRALLPTVRRGRLPPGRGQPGPGIRRCRHCRPRFGQARRPRWPTAPRRPTQPTHPTQSTQSMHPTHATQRLQPMHPTSRCTPRMPTPKNVSTLPATPTLPDVATLPATATLPDVATLPATAPLPAVATLPATATLPAVAMLPATATLPAVATLPATAMLPAAGRCWRRRCWPRGSCRRPQPDPGSSTSSSRPESPTGPDGRAAPSPAPFVQASRPSLVGEWGMTTFDITKRADPPRPRRNGARDRRLRLVRGAARLPTPARREADGPTAGW